MSARPWNHNSWVKPACETCNGEGTVASHRRPSIWDPYPEDCCDDCDGEPHEPECEVCGYNLEIDGFDCLACETVAHLGDKYLNQFDADKFAAAVKSALGAALAAQVREAA